MTTYPPEALAPLPGQPLLGERESNAPREMDHMRRQALSRRRRQSLARFAGRASGFADEARVMRARVPREPSHRTYSTRGQLHTRGAFGARHAPFRRFPPRPPRTKAPPHGVRASTNTVRWKYLLAIPGTFLRRERTPRD